MDYSKKIPAVVSKVVKELENKGFEAYLVGGCVRDLILNREPNDWDITTNATPEEIQAVFPDSFYENTFGTVGVKTDSEDPRHKIVEVTPYRLEGVYSDSRHPDKVEFSKRLEDDLERRDFTINAIAYGKGQIIDLYKGQKDLSDNVLKTVGDPNKRFTEDALRILRAIRLASELGFSIDKETYEAILLHVKQLEKVSRERIRDEFTKIVMSNNPAMGMFLLEKTGILEIIAPILRETVNVQQNKEAHKYDVWEHLVRSLQYAAEKKFSLEIRLAALFHDVSKPETKRISAGNTTFYGHEVIGARVTHETLSSLRYSKDLIEKVTLFVRWHMFFSDPEQITLSAVRRVIAKVGKENIWDLMNLRVCDRVGSGRQKEEPYRLRKYKSMIEEALRDPVSVSMLKINGDVLVNDLKIEKGPKIGHILHALFDEVLDDPSKNDSNLLKKRAQELSKLNPAELQKLGIKGKDRLSDKDDEIIKEIRSKYHVK